MSLKRYHFITPDNKCMHGKSHCGKIQTFIIRGIAFRYSVSDQLSETFQLTTIT